MLYSPVECNNRLRCEFVQHVLFNLKTLLRINNPVDRDRPKVLDLSQYSVVEDGMSFIPAQERHQIDPRLVEGAQSQMRQLMSEGSASFVQNINDGTSKEMTATETAARVQSVNVQVSAMLQSMYAQEEFFYEEVVRRFCDPHSEDKEVEEFQKKCIADGIPKELMKASNWSIKVERALGAGDQFIATQEANALLSQSQRFDPQSQRFILKKWVSTTTRDPKMADFLVPTESKVSKGATVAQDVFGTLLAGIPIAPREGIERQDHIAALLEMLTEKIQQIAQTEIVPTATELIGLSNIATYIEQNIEIMASDPLNKQIVKQFGDALGRLTNEIKAMGQRFQEQQQADAEQSMVDPEAQAKIQLQAQMGEQKMALSAASAEQKMRLKETQAQQQLATKQAQFEQQMQQQLEKHRVEMQALIEETQAQIAAKGFETGASIKNDEEKTRAKIENDKKTAEASVKKKPEPVNN